MKNKLTIVIPVKERKNKIDRFIEYNKEMLNSNKLIIIDTVGGEKLKDYSFIYVIDYERKYTMSKARRLGIDLVNTPYILNLDVDVKVPNKYIESAITIMNINGEVGAVSIDYENLQGHLPFGNSIWRTNILKKLYDYDESKRICECLYMWGKLNRTKYRLETIEGLRCKHLKGE